MDADDIATMRDPQLWDFLAGRLGPDHDWASFLQGPAIARVREALVRHRAAIYEDLQTCEHVDDRMERKARGRQQMMEARLAEVNAALKEYNRTTAQQKQDERDRRLAHALKLLTLEVFKHRRAVLAADMAPTGQDLQLWGSLHWLKIPLSAGGEASLEWMIEHHWQKALQHDEED